MQFNQLSKPQQARHLSRAIQAAVAHTGADYEHAKGVLETFMPWGYEELRKELSRTTKLLLGDCAQEMHLVQVDGRRPKPTTRPLTWAGKLFLAVTAGEKNGREVYLAQALGYPRAIAFPARIPGIEVQPQVLDRSQVCDLVFLIHAWSWAFEVGLVDEAPVRILNWSGFYDRLDKLVLASGAWTPPKADVLSKELEMERLSWITSSGEKIRGDARWPEDIAPDADAEVDESFGHTAPEEGARFLKEINGLLTLPRAGYKDHKTGARITGLFLHPEKTLVISGEPRFLFQQRKLNPGAEGIKEGGVVVMPPNTEDLYWKNRNGILVAPKDRFLREEDRVPAGCWPDGTPRFKAREGMKRDFEDIVRGAWESGGLLVGLQFRTSPVGDLFPKARYWEAAVPGRRFPTRYPEVMRRRDPSGRLWLKCPGTHPEGSPSSVAGNGVEVRPFRVMPHGDVCVTCGFTFNQVTAWLIMKGEGLGLRKGFWVATPANGPFVGLLAQQFLRENGAEVPAMPGEICWPLVLMPDLLPPKWVGGKQVWESVEKGWMVGRKPLQHKDLRKIVYDGMGRGHVWHPPTGLKICINLVPSDLSPPIPGDSSHHHSRWAPLSPLLSSDPNSLFLWKRSLEGRDSRWKEAGPCVGVVL